MDGMETWRWIFFTRVAAAAAAQTPAVQRFSFGGTDSATSTTDSDTTDSSDSATSSRKKTMLQNWNTTNVKSITSMFYNATWMDQVVLCWDLPNVEQADNVFCQSPGAFSCDCVAQDTNNGIKDTNDKDTNGNDTKDTNDTNEKDNGKIAASMLQYHNCPAQPVCVDAPKSTTTTTSTTSNDEGEL